MCLYRWDCTHVNRRLRIKIVNLEFACSFLYLCFATLTHFFLCKGSDIWVWYHKHSFWLSIFRQDTRSYTCLTFFVFACGFSYSINIVHRYGMVRIHQIWTIPLNEVSDIGHSPSFESMTEMMCTYVYYDPPVMVNMVNGEWDGWDLLGHVKGRHEMTCSVLSLPNLRRSSPRGSSAWLAEFLARGRVGRTHVGKSVNIWKMA